ncbi:MAG: helix-turn-helix domain-containing protein [Pseudomonadota bacterium]|nr:helix-turn-helix domain-containing protein [Pseudomonadota bacterium]
MTASPDKCLVTLLERRRRESALSQRDLSVAAGYGEKYWEKVVGGYHRASLAAFCDHAEVLGFSFRLMRDA